MEINAIVQQILLTNDYASLPGLGSFVRRYDPAKVADDGVTLLPPQETVVFDSSRAFNDEALENYLVEHRGMSKPEAEKELTEFCQNVRLRLDRGESVFFHGIGNLRKTSDGSIVVESDEKLISSTFGLPPIVLERSQNAEATHVNAEAPSQEVLSTADQKGFNTIHEEKPAKRKTTRIVLVLVVFITLIGLAAILLFPKFRQSEPDRIAVSQTTEQANPADQQVSSSENIDTEPIEPKDTVKQSPTDIAAEATTPSAKLEKPEIPKQADRVVPVPIDKKSALFYQDREVEQDKTFYIVVGSFASRVNAEKLVNELSIKGFKPTIIPGNNIYRVVIYQFTNRDRALRELERVRNLRLTDKAWILTQ